MKKNLLLRLCLILLVALTAYSCRTDQFPEQETHNNSSKFQLISRRISLDEARHKAKLLPELQKAEKEVEKQKLNIQEKLVNVGNGITIDTDEVIYLENGPNFHTYTFTVIRDNAPVNAPVENLLLTPNPDGSYRVFHIVLNLTEADKARIANKEYVDYKNKEQVTELGSINLSSLSQKQICIPHYYSYPVKCKDNLHEPGEACAYAGEFGAAYWGSIVLYDCFGEEPETIMPTPTPGDGGGGGGGECSDCPDNSTPEPCVQIATDPTQVGIVDPNGCIVGIPTDPNLPLPDRTTPCQKTKKTLESQEVEEKNNELKDKSKIGGEKGFNIKADGTTSAMIDGGEHEVDMGSEVGWQGGYHNHTPTGVKIFSPPDILKLLNYAISQPNGTYGNAFFGVIGSEPCTTCTGGYKYHNYIIRFNGTGQDLDKYLYQTTWDKEQLKSDYTRMYKDMLDDPLYVDHLDDDNLNSNGLQKLFFDTLTNMGMKGKVNLQRIDDSIVQNITQDSNGNSTTATPCP